MYVDKSVFKDENDKKNEAIDDAKKLHNRKEELNTLKSKAENSELEFDNKIVQEK